MSTINTLDHSSGSSMKPLDIAFLAANAVGIGLCLRLASRGWRIPEQHGAVPIAGKPFVWALALPVLGVFFLADAVWGGLLLRGWGIQEKAMVARHCGMWSLHREP